MKYTVTVLIEKPLCMSFTKNGRAISIATVEQYLLKNHPDKKFRVRKGSHATRATEIDV